MFVRSCLSDYCSKCCSTVQYVPLFYPLYNEVRLFSLARGCLRFDLLSDMQKNRFVGPLLPVRCGYQNKLKQNY